MIYRNAKDENINGNTRGCQRLELLQAGFAKGAACLCAPAFFSLLTQKIAAARVFNPSLEPLDSKLSKYINGNPVRVDGKPRASGIMDTVYISFSLVLPTQFSSMVAKVRAAIANGIKVPPEFENKAIVDIIVSGNA